MSSKVFHVRLSGARMLRPSDLLERAPHLRLHVPDQSAQEPRASGPRRRPHSRPESDGLPGQSCLLKGSALGIGPAAAAQDGRGGCARRTSIIGNVLNHRDPKTIAGYAYLSDTTASRCANQPWRPSAHLCAAGTARPCGTEAGTERRAPCRFVLYRPARQPTRPPPALLQEGGPLRSRWTAPVMEVASRLGVSDVALASYVAART